jgi:hypothetical protein
VLQAGRFSAAGNGRGGGIESDGIARRNWVRSRNCVAIILSSRIAYQLQGFRVWVRLDANEHLNLGTEIATCLAHWSAGGALGI